MLLLAGSLYLDIAIVNTFSLSICFVSARFRQHTDVVECMDPVVTSELRRLPDSLNHYTGVFREHEETLLPGRLDSGKNVKFEY